MEGRLILDEARPGAMNMAIDEMLLYQVAETGNPVLRFYEWSQPTLSLGYFQRHIDREQHRASLNCDIVRRASGGGAILHDRELTYSLVLPQRSRHAKSMHLRVHKIIAHLLNQFRVPAKICEPQPGCGDEPFLCFQRRAAGDLLLGDFKICGSAQRKNRGVVLQHGSLLLEKSQFAPELPGLFDLADKFHRFSALKTSVIQSIAGSFYVRTQDTSELSDSELASAKEIADSKFGGEHWTLRR